MTLPLEKVPSRTPPHPPLYGYYSCSTQRPAFLTYLFDQAASDYGWINLMVSLGSGVWYRRRALREAELSPGMKVLDLACGSGLVTHWAADIVGASGFVVGLDASRGMLREARKRHCPHLVRGVCETLPFPNDSFDFVTMGYALRHVSDLVTTFREYARVLKPGGRALLLEVSRPASVWSYYLTRLYLKTVVPWAIGLTTSNEHTRILMRYFWDTIEHCVPPETILAALEDAGFARCDLREHFGGLLRDYQAVRV